MTLTTPAVDSIDLMADGQANGSWSISSAVKHGWHGDHLNKNAHIEANTGVMIRVSLREYWN